MDELKPAMEPNDLLCILPLIESELKEVLSFEALHCLLPIHNNHSQKQQNSGAMAENPIYPLGVFNLSDRQKRRVEESLALGQPFWDAVGYNVFLPLILDDQTLNHHTTTQIVLGIRGVNRLVNMEEASRWLGLLKQYLHLLVQHIFMQTLIAAPSSDLKGDSSIPSPGDKISYPPFLGYYLQKMAGCSTDFAIVHLKQSRRLSENAVAHMNDAATFCAQAKAICMRLWPSVRLKYLGGSEKDAWFAIFNKNHLQESPLKYEVLASNLRRFWEIFSPDLAKRFSIHLHFEKETKPSISSIMQTEFLASQLGTRIFSSRDMALLQQKNKAFRISEALQTINALESPPKAAAFLSCETDENINIHDQLTQYLPAHLQAIPAGETSVFIVSNERSSDTLTIAIEDALKSLNESNSMPLSFLMGIACEGKALRVSSLSNPAIAALYAHIHASLLPESEWTALENHGGLRLKKAIFDALTLHVAGDELFAMGDMDAACKMFKGALALASRQNTQLTSNQHSTCNTRHSNVVTPALLNSLGIAILQTGRRSAAIRYFEQALGQFPGDIMAYYNLSGILLDMKQLDRAEMLLRQAAQLAPQDIHITIRLANCLFEKGETNAALGLLATFMTRNEAELPATFFKLQGRLGMKNGNWGYAKENLNKALARAPYDAETLFFLANGYLTIENDPKTARRLLNQAALLTNSKELQKKIAELQRRIEKIL